jgi:hypothetical protein
MEKSLFAQWVDKYFAPLVTKIVETVNGDKNPLTYRYKTMLRKNYSTTLKWGSLSSKGKAVAADVVAMDSSLPLKSRPSISTAEGDIPKIGMALYLNERTLSELDILAATNQNDSNKKMIIQKLFEDAKRVVVGVSEQLEYQFLEALSTGYCLVPDETNTGIAIRLNFQHPDENKFGVGTVWSDADAKPLTDIENVLEKARLDGNTVTKLFMDRKAWNNMKSKAEVKELFAMGRGFAGANISTPSVSALNEVLRDNYGFEIEIIDRSVRFEKNGKETVKTPWASGVVVFVTSDIVGDLTWGKLAEMNHPAKQVDYTIADDFILVSKFHNVNPLREWTTSQALAVPVINDVDSIYIMNSEEAQTTEGQTEGDATITIYEDTSVLVVNLVNAINSVSKKGASTDMTDKELILLVNSLTNAQETKLKAILEIPVVDAGDDEAASAAVHELSGTATAAGDKTIASTLWSNVSGPSTPTFDDATALTTNANGLVTGAYVFKLTATDSEGTVASDTVTITATVE